MSAILGAQACLPHDILRHHETTPSFLLVDTHTPSRTSASSSVTSSSNQPSESSLVSRTESSFEKPLKRRQRQHCTKTSPTCHHCRKSIVDSYFCRVGGRKFHESCAVCSVCSVKLTDPCFMLHDGKLFCPCDYERLHAVRCANCVQPMRSHELCMRAEAPTSRSATECSTDAQSQRQFIFHVSCFTCSVCQQPLAVGDRYTIDSDGRLMCHVDFIHTHREASKTSLEPFCDSFIQSTTNRSDHHDRHLGVSSSISPEHVWVSQRPDHHRHPSHSGIEVPPVQSDYASDLSIKPVAHPDVHNSSSNRRIRTSLTESQRIRLQHAYDQNSRPSKQARDSLAHELSVPLRVVQVWFQNQRARDKRASTQGHSNGLRACISSSHTGWLDQNATRSTSHVPLSFAAVQPSTSVEFSPSPRTSVDSSSSYPEYSGFRNDNMRTAIIGTSGQADNCQHTQWKIPSPGSQFQLSYG